MTVEAAATLAQVLPALLAAGILVPLLSEKRTDWKDRTLFKQLAFFILFVEGLCIWSVMVDVPLPWYFSFIVGAAVLYSLFSIFMIFSDWAKKTDEEKEEDESAKKKLFLERRELLTQAVSTVRKLFRSRI